jgi:hypothetical protein
MYLTAMSTVKSAGAAGRGGVGGGRRRQLGRAGGGARPGGGAQWRDPRHARRRARPGVRMDCGGPDPPFPAPPAERGAPGGAFKRPGPPGATPQGGAPCPSRASPGRAWARGGPFCGCMAAGRRGGRAVQEGGLYDRPGGHPGARRSEILSSRASRSRRRGRRGPGGRGLPGRRAGGAGGAGGRRRVDGRRGVVRQRNGSNHSPAGAAAAGGSRAARARAGALAARPPPPPDPAAPPPPRPARAAPGPRAVAIAATPSLRRRPRAGTQQGGARPQGAGAPALGHRPSAIHPPTTRLLALPQRQP